MADVVALPKLNVYHWVCKFLVNKVHDECFESSRGLLIDGKNYGSKEPRAF